MKKLKKPIFIRSVCALVGVLFLVRLCLPGVVRSAAESVEADTVAVQADKAVVEETPLPSVEAESVSSTKGVLNSGPQSVNLVYFPLPQLDFTSRHRITSVPSYARCFPDVQDTQIVAARRFGVPPVANRAEAERRKSELLYVGANPYYEIDPRMNRSIPYLVPRASHLLEHISRRFLDSLAVKQIPLHKLIVTSVLRTEEDVARLTRYNHNALDQSCHRFGTTFDISYNRFHTMAPPTDPNRRAVRNDSLKFVLSEVLRDVRQEGRCYVKYEVKQGCFHITVR